MRLTAADRLRGREKRDDQRMRELGVSREQAEFSSTYPHIRITYLEIINYPVTSSCDLSPVALRRSISIDFKQSGEVENSKKTTS